MNEALIAHGRTLCACIVISGRFDTKRWVNTTALSQASKIDAH